MREIKSQNRGNGIEEGVKKIKLKDQKDGTLKEYSKDVQISVTATTAGNS